VATFNIENYPKSYEQVDGVFTILRDLGVSALAVQEITDPDHFAGVARRRLGDSWRFVHSGPVPMQRVGVLFDEDAFDLQRWIVHRETVVYNGGKPAVEARLRSRAGGPTLRFFSVHLKASTGYEETRRRQLAALTPVLQRAVQSGDRVVLAGDFNATSEADRGTIVALAEVTGLHWVTEDLECSHFWERDDACIASRLDHVLMSWTPTTVAARGPCETEGCDVGGRCPIFRDEVSDHCPVTIDYE
jgi:hypothetical protein